MLYIKHYIKRRKTAVRLIKNLFLKKHEFHKIPPKWKNGERGDIILVHGFGGDWIYLKKIGNLGNKMGFRVHVVEGLGINTLKIDHARKEIESYIEKNDLKKISLISHSKGGIISKYFLDYSRLGSHIQKVITIASPFKGTRLAKIRLFNLHELAPGSNLLKKINRRKKSNKKIFNLYPKFDDAIIPNGNLLLEGATNIKIDTVGHIEILNSRQTLKEIEKILNA